LLFPVTNKNYSSNPFINSQWNALRNRLKIGPMRLTIFGYSAPTSDMEAKKIMEEAYGSVKEKKNHFAEIEIIDVKKEQLLKKAWKNFILRDHVTVLDSFFDSWIMRFPRRSGEAHFDTYCKCLPHPVDKPPIFTSLSQMQDWYLKFMIHEGCDY
jgi:hypothetical protein